jgi:hypothetical protein
MLALSQLLSDVQTFAIDYILYQVEGRKTKNAFFVPQKGDKVESDIKKKKKDEVRKKHQTNQTKPFDHQYIIHHALVGFG